MATQSVVIASNSSVLCRMAKAGIPFEDARWFHHTALGGGFKTAEELCRVLPMLVRVRNAVPRVVRA